MYRQCQLLLENCIQEINFHIHSNAWYQGIIDSLKLVWISLIHTDTRWQQIIIKLKYLLHLANTNMGWLRPIEILSAFFNNIGGGLIPPTNVCKKDFPDDTLAPVHGAMRQFWLSAVFCACALTVNGTWILPAGLGRETSRLWMGCLAGGHWPQTCALLVTCQKLKGAVCAGLHYCVLRCVKIVR